MGDLISRSALWNDMSQFAKKMIAEENCVPTWNDAISLVGSAPDVEMVPVAHGRWLERTVRGSKSLVCSVCRSDAGTICEMPRCAFCGAIMDLEVE